MKSLKQIREHRELIIEREEAEERKLTSLVRAGLFDSKKLPALKRALDKSADKISGQEKRMLINLLDSLIDQVLSNQSVYQKVKQNVMKEEYLDEGRLDPTTRDINDLPNIIMLRRRAIRSFPGGGKVVMYWADKINRYIPIPVDPVNTITRGPHLDSGLTESYDDYLKHIHTAYSKHDEDDPEIAQHLANAHAAYKNIPKGIQREKAKIAGRAIEKKAKEIRLTSLRKKAGGEHGYVAQAAGFAKSGQKAAALGTLVGGGLGSLVRHLAKEGLETTRIKMKKMTVSPLTGVRKNEVLREEFRSNIETQRGLNEGPWWLTAVTAGKNVLKYGDDAIKTVGKYADDVVKDYRAGRAVATAEKEAAAAAKAAKAAKRGEALNRLKRIKSKNRNPFRGKNPKKTRTGLAGNTLRTAELGASVIGGLSNLGAGSSSSKSNYQTQRRDLSNLPGESSFKTNASRYDPRDIPDRKLQRKAFQTESVIKELKSITEGQEKNITLRDGNSIDIGYGLATKIINIYESMNKNNKQTMANMLEESVDNFKKIGQFAIDNGK